MDKYICVKPSQIHLFETVPFYYETQGESFALYKKGGDRLQRDRCAKAKHPPLFIAASDRDVALKEMGEALNLELIRSIADRGLMEIKHSLCRIVDEALTPNQEVVMECLPATLEIMLTRLGKKQGALEHLADLAASSKLLVEHTVNVTALTLQYCLFHNLSEERILQLGLAALLHDAGFSRLDARLVETRKWLTEEEYSRYQRHTVIGHDILKDNKNFDPLVIQVALEHHERQDGSGYPFHKTDINPDCQLISIIDSYESLTYRDKHFRQKQKPFHSLNLIKSEVLAGHFDKEIFKTFTSCLVK